MTWRPSSIRDRLEPGSYHAKHVAGQALTGLVRQRRHQPAPTPAQRRDGLRAGHRYRLRAHLRRPALWRHLPGLLRDQHAARRRLEAQIAAEARCAERGHITYVPDRSCLPSCTLCVRCGREHHARGPR